MVTTPVTSASKQPLFTTTLTNDLSITLLACHWRSVLVQTLQNDHQAPDNHFTNAADAMVMHPALCTFQKHQAQFLSDITHTSGTRAELCLGWPERSPTFGSHQQSHHGKLQKTGNSWAKHVCDLCRNMPGHESSCDPFVRNRSGEPREDRTASLRRDLETSQILYGAKFHTWPPHP